MILQLKRIICDWERSGKGDGGVIDESDTLQKPLMIGKLSLMGIQLISFIFGRCWWRMVCSALQCNVWIQAILQEMAPMESLLSLHSGEEVTW